MMIGENPLLVLLKRELRGGERLLWAEQPKPGPVFRKSFGIYLFAVPWTAFSLFWEAMAASAWFSDQGPNGIVEAGAGLVMPLFGLPFVAIGIGMLSVPFWVRRKAAQTIYGVTDARLIELTGGRRLRVRSVDPQAIGPITRHQNASGSGTLSIETGSHRDSDGDRVTDRFELSDIDEVAKVEQMVLRLKDAHAA